MLRQLGENVWSELKRLRVQDLSWDRDSACPVTQEKMGRQGRRQGIHLPDRLGAQDGLHGACRHPGDDASWL